MDTSVVNSTRLQFHEELQNGNLIALNGANPDMYRCNICLCDISGIMQAESHAVGSKHAKKLKAHSIQMSLKHISETEFPAESKKYCVAPNITIPAIQTENGAAVPSSPALHALNNLQPSEFYCHVCQVGLNSKQTFKQHIEGTKHAKKLKFSESMRSLNSSSCNSSSCCSSRSSSASPPAGDSITFLKSQTDPLSPVSNGNGLSSDVSRILTLEESISLSSDSDELIIVGPNEPIPKLF